MSIAGMSEVVATLRATEGWHERANPPAQTTNSPLRPVHTVPEFIAYTRVRPGQINFASPGIGTTIHLSGELFNMMTGVKMVHVP
jgi:tripartite-type tricarboxylate transporter receptor subunit TctC